MKRFILIISLILCALPNMNAQKVGLVLSGGGAKGLTHIGIIRALEENNIPIDYITGTSMGAIIGSLYAIGYSPDDMEELIESPEFKSWYTGQVAPEYTYFFKEKQHTPEMLNIRFSLKDSLKSNRIQIPQTSLVNPIYMNIVFMDLYGRANAACKNDFNKLFVPFRCVASDIYNKRALILSKGNLGESVRASMSFPFVFKPITINGTLAYDGGIYDNFPVDIMEKDFKPDVIIGSIVSGNPPKPTEHDILTQLQNMIMQKTDYNLPKDKGVLMRFKYKGIGLMDFDKLKQLEGIGYRKTIGLMDSIKMKVKRRVSEQDVKNRRKAYKTNLPKLRFKNIYVTGCTPQQEKFIRREFQEYDGQIFSYEDFKRGYFRLLAGELISEIVPSSMYDPETGLFDLYLNVNMENNILLKLGGTLHSNGANQIYLGLNYRSLNNFSKALYYDMQIGKVYTNFQLMGRIDLPTTIPSSYRLIGSYSTFDFYKTDKIFSKADRPTFNSKVEKFVKGAVMLPFMNNKRMEMSVGYGQLEDYYYQTNTINLDKDREDRSRYNLLGASLGFYGSTLNYVQYANKGHSEKLVAQIFTGKEYYRKGHSADNNLPIRYNDKKISWMQVELMKETYHNLTPHFTLGWMTEAFYSTKNFSENYTATKMQAKAFAPTPHSKLMYNEAFRNNQFFATGIKPIVTINDKLQLRTELYGFLPIFDIIRGENNKAYYSKAFSKFEYMGEISLVYELPFMAVSAYVNHYSSPKSNWNVGFTLGWQLFNKRFIE